MEVHTPPVPGESCVVPVRQMEDGPSIEIAGLGLTKIVFVGNDGHPVAEDVKVKLTKPGPVALISPSLLIVAVEGLLDVQVPGPGLNA